MKRFYSLLSLLLLFAVTAAAQVTDISSLSNNKKYTISCARGYMYYDTTNGIKAGTTSPTLDDNYYFAIVTAESGDMYLYSVGAKQYVNKSSSKTSLTSDPSQTITIAASSNSSYPWFISVNGSKLNHNNAGDIMTNWESEDGGNQWAITEAGTFNGDSLLDVLNLAVYKSLHAAYLAKAQAIVSNNEASAVTSLSDTITANTLGESETATTTKKKYQALKAAVEAVDTTSSIPVKVVNTVDGLPGTLSSSIYHFESGVYAVPASDVLRFTVSATNTGTHFFSLSEFNLLKENGDTIKLEASQFSTNAQESSEGLIANICDGNTSTYFHSSWSTTVEDDHYIQIQLPENITSFKFSFDSRNASNVPSTIIITPLDSKAAAEATALTAAKAAYADTLAIAQLYADNNPEALVADVKQAINENALADTDTSTEVTAKTAALNKAIAGVDKSKATGFLLTTEDGLPGTKDEERKQYHFDSAVYTRDYKATGLKLIVIHSNTGDMDGDGSGNHECFALSEFNVLTGAGDTITLAESNFSTNAEESSEGSIANICDGNTSTYFHSMWSAAPNPEAFHHLKVTFPEAMDSFKFSFDSRNERTVPQEAFLVISLSETPTTGIISAAAPTAEQRPAVIYDLQGRRVSKALKGVYIIDGKKVLK